MSELALQHILGGMALDPEALAFAREVLRVGSAPRGRKTGVRPSQPYAVEQEYARLTRAVASATGDALRVLVMEWARQGGDVDGLRRVLTNLRHRLIGAREVEAEVERIAYRVTLWNAVDMAQVLGIPVDVRAKSTEALSLWRLRQVALVRSVAEQQIDRVEQAALAFVADSVVVDAPATPLHQRGVHGVGRARQIAGATEEQARAVAASVENAVARGTRAEALAETLQDELGISQRRAELIARDQILAANAALTRQQHQDAGVDEYEWSTSGDDRVRPEHEHANGKIFRWDGSGAPAAGVKGASAHPGEAILCRCVALPHFG